ncbi:unnamed protein product [Schistosoma bovis]|nr:unnamed protein product [Schistosoma bovis]
MINIVVCQKLLHIGIIYDSELGITGEALINRFSELQEKMEYYADFPIRNYSLASPPKLKLTIREFTFGLVCNFVENDVHVIISLTTCTLAQLIEAQITPYRIPHIAIPRPACSREIINLSNVKMTTTTIWIQPTPEQTGRAIYEMSEIERASQALLLADKPNLETNIALDYILQAEMNDEKFVPYISTQMFSITNQSNPMYPTSNTYDTIDVLLKHFRNMKSRSSSFLLSHIFHIQVRPLDLNQLYMIYQDRFTFRNLYWILPTTLTITPNELIRVATTNQFEQVATGFFRQFPILNEEDCLNLNVGENMRLLMSEIFQCNTNNITLSDTRTLDKSWTLLHFIVETIETQFPALVNFDDELTGVVEAAKVPTEALTNDVAALVSGMSQADKETIIFGSLKTPQRLSDFVLNNKSKVESIEKQAETARNMFARTIEWFGEAQIKPSPEQFFSLIVRFIKNFKNAIVDNEARRRVEALQSLNSVTGDDNGPLSSINQISINHIPKRPKDKRLAQEARLAKRRFKNRTRQITGDGMMDEILAGLISEPLQAEVHPHRNRLSENNN